MAEGGWGPWITVNGETYRTRENPYKEQLLPPNYLNTLERKNAIAVEALKRLRDNAHHLGGACEWVDEVTVTALTALGEAG